jgi:hypothetical protein
MLLPRRPSRNSFLNYVDKQEIVRLKRDADQPVETKEGVSVALAPKLRSPVVTRQPSAGRNDVRRSRRFRKRPDRYGYSN